MSPELELLSAAVLRIVDGANPADWTCHGFGMARTYLDPARRFRLNIWHSSLAVPGVSAIHDHPWHFTSWVLYGQLTNVRYAEIVSPRDVPGLVNPVQHVEWSRIRTGEGGGPEGERGECHLVQVSDRTYGAGEKYDQRAREIHETRYVDGTVTVNDRSRLSPESNPRVFWPIGTSWVDAAPRQPTEAELARVISSALLGT